MTQPTKPTILLSDVHKLAQTVPRACCALPRCNALVRYDESMPLLPRARFSITARLTWTVTTAIISIPDTTWVPIRYPNAIYDEHEQRWVSDAEVAEVGFTA